MRGTGAAARGRPGAGAPPRPSPPRREARRPCPARPRGCGPCAGWWPSLELPGPVVLHGALSWVEASGKLMFSCRSVRRSYVGHRLYALAEHRACRIPPRQHWRQGGWQPPSQTTSRNRRGCLPCCGVGPRTKATPPLALTHNPTPVLRCPRWWTHRPERAPALSPMNLARSRLHRVSLPTTRPKLQPFKPGL